MVAGPIGSAASSAAGFVYGLIKDQGKVVKCVPQSGKGLADSLPQGEGIDRFTVLHTVKIQSAWFTHTRAWRRGIFKHKLESIYICTVFPFEIRYNVVKADTTNLWTSVETQKAECEKDENEAKRTYKQRMAEIERNPARELAGKYMKEVIDQKKRQLASLEAATKRTEAKKNQKWGEIEAKRTEIKAKEGEIERERQQGRRKTTVLDHELSTLTKELDKLIARYEELGRRFDSLADQTDKYHKALGEAMKIFPADVEPERLKEFAKQERDSKLRLVDAKRDKYRAERKRLEIIDKCQYIQDFQFDALDEVETSDGILKANSYQTVKVDSTLTCTPTVESGEDRRVKVKLEWNESVLGYGYRADGYVEFKPDGTYTGAGKFYKRFHRYAKYV